MESQWMVIALNILVVGVIVLHIFRAYWQGFIVTVLRFFPMVLSLAGICFLIPSVSQMLRQTFIFSAISDSISERMQLEVLQKSTQTQMDLIHSTSLPDFVKEVLLENNNSVVYDLLDATGIVEYISGFLANICINVISVILVFICVYAAVSFVIQALKLVSKLPVLNFFNRICGAVLGLIQGVMTLWIWGMMLTFIQIRGWIPGFFEILQEAKFALFFYENNILLNLVLRIFT